MEKRGVLGLSMEVLVVIIISLVVLVGGISLLYKFIGGAEQIKSDLDVRTKQEIERIITDQGKSVALPFHTAEIFRGENHVFGIGILNIDDGNKEFRLQVDLAQAIGEQENILTGVDAPSWLLYNQETMLIDQNEHRTESILVNVPVYAQKGQYVFNVKVFTPSDQYGNTQKMYVTVK